MPECRYCDASFEDEAAYHDHLEAAHRDELGRIDERRLGLHKEGEQSDGSNAIIVVAVVLAVAVVLVGLLFVLQSSGTGDAGTDTQQPADIGSAHYHGTLEMVVGGERIDFSRNRYQLQADAFHFEGGDGTQWHVHARGVTLEYALGTLGFEVTPSSITVDGTTYDDADQGTTVTITVNEQPVTPGDYVLQQGDQIRIVVE